MGVRINPARDDQLSRCIDRFADGSGYLFQVHTDHRDRRPVDQDIGGVRIDSRNNVSVFN